MVPQADGFDVAGSFLLRALAKPSLNVDLALRMPSECLVARDSLNHRYLDKRALYAGHLAATAMDTEGPLGKLVDKVEVWNSQCQEICQLSQALGSVVATVEAAYRTTRVVSSMAAEHTPPFAIVALALARHGFRPRPWC